MRVCVHIHVYVIVRSHQSCGQYMVFMVCVWRICVCVCVCGEGV